MDQSTIPHVYTAIVAVIGDLARVGVGKNRRNQQQNYQFRGADDIANALAPLLSAHGLVMLPRVVSRVETERPSKAGGVLVSVIVTVEYTLVSARDGSMHVVTTVGEAMDSGDKATNKAMTAAWKYAAIQVFAIPTEGSDDADASSPEPAPRAHDSEWDADRARFCAALESSGLTYDLVRDWHVATHGTKPSQVGTARRRELVTYLRGEGRGVVTEWAARGAAKAK
jgi:hypothetical protein